MTDTDCAHDIDALITLLARQADLYGKLADLSAHQSGLIDSPQDGAAEQLLRLIGARQVLVDQLAQINAQLEPARRDWDKITAALTDAQKQQIAPLVEKSQNLLAAIIAGDETDRKRLEQSKSQTIGQLGRVTGAAHAAAAYRKPIGNTNAFTNHSA